MDQDPWESIDKTILLCFRHTQGIWFIEEIIWEGLPYWSLAYQYIEGTHWICLKRYTSIEQHYILFFNRKRKKDLLKWYKGI